MENKTQKVNSIVQGMTKVDQQICQLQERCHQLSMVYEEAGKIVGQDKDV